eukprot:XP_011661199.1 PREDICTED: receptor-type tyrosine-protein phosphatase delta-like [Strongylocentrotus purpuratus]
MSVSMYLLRLRESMPIGSRVYWCDRRTPKIKSVDLWGNDRMVHLATSPGSYWDLAVVDDSIIWTDYSYDAIGVTSTDSSSGYSFYYHNTFQEPRGIHVYREEMPTATEVYNPTTDQGNPAPGMPGITELTPHQEDSGTPGLTVSWQPPSSPPCQPTHYEIKYYVLQGDMCEDNSRDRIMTSAGTVNGATFTFNVLELRPNSEYRVFVRGRTSSGYGDSDSQSATTGYSYPTGPPTNIQSASKKKRSIVFTWDKPECGNRNGPITSYEVMLSNSTGDMVYHGNVSTGAASAGYEISDLIPYSNYSIRIRAWNYELAGEYGPAIWKQTGEAKPAPPIGVNLPSSDQESITVEWMSPNPPLGRIIGYYILYWETFGNSSTPRNVSFSCQDGLCFDINYRFSRVIPDLRPDTNYSVQVNAETIRGVGDSSPDQPVVRITSEGISSASVSSSGNQLRVRWSVPSQCDVDYYRLSYQLISRKACQDVSVIDAPVYELNVTSSFAYVSKSISNLEYYATYNISIIAVIRRAESLPMNVRGDTRDGDPSAIESVSYTSTAHALRFVWVEPSCESRHGVFDRYEYDLYDPTGGGRYVRYPTTIRRNYVLIPGLDACTEYRFRIRVVNTPLRRSEWHMEMASTNISAPGMPVITGLTPHQEDSVTTGLTVSWQPPSSPPCQPTHYEIKYYVLQGDMCEDTPSVPRRNLTGTVNGSTFTFNVLELPPNSEYMVFVRGRTSSGYGDSDSQSATTGYSYPTGPPTNIQSTSIKKRSIVFSWEKPECSDRNGPISSYEVMLSNSTGDVVYHGNASASAGPELFWIFDLIPYSIYRIRIRALEL